MLGCKAHFHTHRANSRFTSTLKAVDVSSLSHGRWKQFQEVERDLKENLYLHKITRIQFSTNNSRGCKKCLGNDLDNVVQIKNVPRPCSKSLGIDLSIFLQLDKIA